MSNYLVRRTIGGRVWEDGTFGISCVKTSLLESEAFCPDKAANLENALWLNDLAKEHGPQVMLEFYQDMVGNGDPVPFGLSNELISHRLENPRARRGINGITSYGRRLVRNACLRLDRESAGNLSFLTLTLPAVSQAEAKTIARNWSEVVRQLNQSIGRILRSEGLPGEIVGVTELQSQRFHSTGVFALHYHSCFVGRIRDRTPWKISPTMVRQIWQRVLAKHLDSPVDCYNWSAVENIQAVRNSVSAYLGKYLSKGLSIPPDEAVKIYGDVIDYYPSAWYNCSDALRERVLNNVAVLSPFQADVLLNVCSQADWEGWFYWVRPITLSSEAGFVVIGWAGVLHPEGLRMIMTGGRSE